MPDLGFTTIYMLAIIVLLLVLCYLIWERGEKAVNRWKRIAQREHARANEAEASRVAPVVQIRRQS